MRCAGGAQFRAGASRRRSDARRYEPARDYDPWLSGAWLVASRARHQYPRRRLTFLRYLRLFRWQIHLDCGDRAAVLRAASAAVRNRRSRVRQPDGFDEVA